MEEAKGKRGGKHRESLQIPVSPQSHDATGGGVSVTAGALTALMLSSVRRGSSRGNPRASITTSVGDDFAEILDFVRECAGEEDGQPLSRQALLDRIREKKEVIQKLRAQPWSMRRKRRALKLAQKYLERHEAKVSKRHLYEEQISKRLKHFRRFIENIVFYLIPWEAKIKKIENQFGSVVSSYFTFLRWIFWINFIITAIIVVFIVVPEYMHDMHPSAARYNITKERKYLTPEEIKHADHLKTVWDFGGYIEKSAYFYGWYAPYTPGSKVAYHLPLAYFIVNLVVLGYSFVAILRKMAENARQSKMTSGKAEQYVFCWKVFTGWDFTIANAETANNAVMANVIKFRECIAEHRVRMRTKLSWARLCLRGFANTVIVGMMALSGYIILSSVQRSQALAEGQTISFNFLGQNEVAVVVSLITLVFPSLFELVGAMEGWHPRTALRVQLFRVCVLYGLNYYTLIYALLHFIEPGGQPTDSYKSTAAANGTMLARQLRQLGNSAASKVAATKWTAKIGGTTIGVSNVSALQAVASTTAAPVVERHVRCWETVVGQEISKLITMDLVMTIASILLIDFARGLWVRYCNRWWFWNLETHFPEYGEFKVAENVLHIINNQGMIWLGLFFAPLLPALNGFKLIIIMYIRAWACTTCNVPAQQIFRASRSSNFYLLLLLIMLMLCSSSVGYVIGMQTPSTVCGPFSGKRYFYSVLTVWVHANLPGWALQVLAVIQSPGVIIPGLLLFTLVIYFLYSLVRGLKEANSDLKKQLQQERTEEKKKIFNLAGAVNKANELTGPKMPEIVRRNMDFLPSVERKRRQPWHKANKRPSDLDSLYSDSSDDKDSLDTPPRVKPKPHDSPRPTQYSSQGTTLSSSFASVKTPSTPPETPQEIREVYLTGEAVQSVEPLTAGFPSPSDALVYSHRPDNDVSARAGSVDRSYYSDADDNATTDRSHYTTHSNDKRTSKSSSGSRHSSAIDSILNATGIGGLLGRGSKKEGSPLEDGGSGTLRRPTKAHKSETAETFVLDDLNFDDTRVADDFGSAPELHSDVPAERSAAPERVQLTDSVILVSAAELAKGKGGSKAVRVITGRPTPPSTGSPIIKQKGAPPSRPHSQHHSRKSSKRSSKPTSPPTSPKSSKPRSAFKPYVSSDSNGSGEHGEYVLNVDETARLADRRSPTNILRDPPHKQPRPDANLILKPDVLDKPVSPVTPPPSSESTTTTKQPPPSPPTTRIPLEPAVVDQTPVLQSAVPLADWALPPVVTQVQPQVHPSPPVLMADFRPVTRRNSLTRVIRTPELERSFSSGGDSDSPERRLLRDSFYSAGTLPLATSQHQKIMLDKSSTSEGSMKTAPITAQQSSSLYGTPLASMHSIDSPSTSFASISPEKSNIQLRKEQLGLTARGSSDSPRAQRYMVERTPSASSATRPLAMGLGLDAPIPSTRSLQQPLTPVTVQPSITTARTSPQLQQLDRSPPKESPGRAPPPSPPSMPIIAPIGLVFPSDQPIDRLLLGGDSTTSDEERPDLSPIPEVSVTSDASSALSSANRPGAAASVAPPSPASSNKDGVLLSVTTTPGPSSSNQSPSSSESTTASDEHPNRPLTPRFRIASVMRGSASSDGQPGDTPETASGRRCVIRQTPAVSATIRVTTNKPLKKGGKGDADTVT